MKNDNGVQKLYAGRAAIYDRLFVNFLGWGRELATFFANSDYVRPHLKILDAGCGTGVITKTIFHLAHERNCDGVQFHAFDLTQNMLDQFEQWISAQEAENIELQQADVLEINALPAHWKDYDLVISATMLEYLPKDKVRYALTNLKQLLAPGGILLIFVTKRNRLTHWLAEKWWKTNLFNDSELRTFFMAAGFDSLESSSLSPRWSRSILVMEGRNKQRSSRNQ